MTNIDSKRIIVAGESGGGNLTLATGLTLKRDGQLGLIEDSMQQFFELVQSAVVLMKT